MKKGFTLIELVVAVSLMAMVLGFTGVIFNVSIESYRTASANAEIMQNLRAITDQLNADFKGLRKDAPLLIWFYQEDHPDPNRYDQIMFFANGDFQSTQLYDYGLAPDAKPSSAPITGPEKSVTGNVARIYYGQAESRDSLPPYNLEPPWNLTEKKDRLLARRQHILTADADLDTWPNSGATNFNAPDAVGGLKNERYEHDSLSLSQWKAIPNGQYGLIMNVCFGNRPWIDTIDSQDMERSFHKLMCEGVGSFAVQWAYWDDIAREYYWFPSEDPNGDKNYVDSQFGLKGTDQFGVSFNIGDVNEVYRNIPAVEYFDKDFYPDALKFTFRLFDSKGILPEGRVFTHIVYLKD